MTAVSKLATSSCECIAKNQAATGISLGSSLQGWGWFRYLLNIGFYKDSSKVIAIVFASIQIGASLCSGAFSPQSFLSSGR
jgi:hypothetical protein